MRDVAATALAYLPSASTSGQPASHTGAQPISDTVLAAWAAAQHSPSSPVISNAVVDAAARLRENVVFRRAARLDAPAGGFVVAYTHNAVSPGLGTVGVLLAVQPRGGISALHGTPERAVLVAAARRIAMHIAAARPAYLTRSHVPNSVLERERAVHAHGASASGKPANIVARMVDGRLAKWAAETVLCEQPFVLGDDGQRVDATLDAAAKQAGFKAGAIVHSFVHFVVGEAVASETNNASSSNSETRATA